MIPYNVVYDLPSTPRSNEPGEHTCTCGQSLFFEDTPACKKCPLCGTGKHGKVHNVDHVWATVLENNPDLEIYGIEIPYVECVNCRVRNNGLYRGGRTEWKKEEREREKLRKPATDAELNFLGDMIAEGNPIY